MILFSHKRAASNTVFKIVLLLFFFSSEMMKKKPNSTERRKTEIEERDDHPYSDGTGITKADDSCMLRYR